MSSVEHGVSLVKGLAMRAGHSTRPGTRRPPSQSVPLEPRRLPVDFGPAAPPLSELYQSSVLSLTFSSRNAARSRPTLRSTAAISP